jgi:thioredoxin-like negative regulator of GroEL
LSNQQQQQYVSVIRQAAYEQNPAAAIKAITANPDDANAHKALAIVYSSKGQYPAAVAQLKEVVRIRPNDRASASVLSSFLYKTGDRNGALAEWKELAKQDDSWGQSARRHLVKLHHTVQQ